MIKKARKRIENELGVVDKIELLQERGTTSETYKIIIADQHYVLKLSRDYNYRQCLKKEAEAMKRYEDCGISIPICYLFFEEGNVSYLVRNYYEDQTLTVALQNTTLEEQAFLIEGFGQLLRSLHEYVCEGSTNWIQQQLTHSQQSLDEGITSGSQQLLNYLYKTTPDPIISSLIHGECTTDNILVVDGQVKCFIDISNMTIGDARYDVALAIRDFNVQQRNKFYEGYELRRLSDIEYSYFGKGLYEFF